MLSITREQLIEMDPCILDARLAMFGKRKSMNVEQALKAGASIKDLLWVAVKIGRKDLCVQFALECAQRVAHLNSDPRVQAAIDAASAWVKNPTEENQKAAKVAANAAAYAANAAYADAAYAANAAYADAAYAAADAANAAAEAYAAYAAAAYAANAYAANAYAKELEKNEQMKIFVKIFCAKELT